jgi:hypothetical protein
MLQVASFTLTTKSRFVSRRCDKAAESPILTHQQAPFYGTLPDRLQGACREGVKLFKNQHW